jgi:hypothetical protein
MPSLHCGNPGREELISLAGAATASAVIADETVQVFMVPLGRTGAPGKYCRGRVTDSRVAWLSTSKTRT